MVGKLDGLRLNKQQLQAITHKNGPLLVIAGAGTGKTTVITERVKWIIAKKLALPHEILALTFTEKAALQMQERIDIALPYGYSDIWVTTFHAFGERILRQEAIQIGLDPGYRLMTVAEAILFFRKNLFLFDLEYFRPLGNPNKFIQGFLTHFSRLKDEDISPAEYLKWVNHQKSSEEARTEIFKYKELANAYQTYEELKVKEGVMDFSDLISNSLKLFRMRKNILHEFQEKFKFILIDEFQDTNFAQNELARLLASDDQNITVVGDDDQAIYRWRGAALSNIIQFRKHYKRAKIVVLTQNYRSTREILDKSYKLIQFNNPDRLEVKEKVHKKLISSRKIEGEHISFEYKNRVDEEADEVAKRILELKSPSETDHTTDEKTKLESEHEKYQWKHFAILVRANNHADPFTRALARRGIPYQFLGPGMLFRQPEIRDLISYLTILKNLDDSVAFFRVLSMPIFEIYPLDIVRLNSFAQKMNLSLFESVDLVIAHANSKSDHWSAGKNYDSYVPHILVDTMSKLEALHKMIVRHIAMIQSQTAGQILFYFLQDSGILQKMADFKNIQEEKVAINISKFFEKLKTFELSHQEASVHTVLAWIEMAFELGESPLAANSDWNQNDAVNILTIHSAKGLEFPVVFLVNLVVGRFPTQERHEQIPIPDALIKEILPEGDYHQQEERRLFYVGMTRAKDKLIFTASNYYGEGKRSRKISPFVYEALGKKMENIIPLDKPIGNQLTLLEWKKEEKNEEKPIRQSITYLSYSQIQTFLTCPLQYKYRYILHIPVSPTAAGSFGTSIHAALQHFYEQVNKGISPTKDDLLHLLKTNWLPVGYASKAYEQKMKQRGENMLIAFYEKAYDPTIRLDSLEKLFTIRLTPTLKLGGKIDRIDMQKNGKIEIVDYKTGKRPSDKEIQENLQMTVYALAATDKGILGKDPSDVILSFYFLQTQEKVTSSRNSDQLEEAKKKLKQIATDIETSEFPPKVGKWCDFCDFRLICEAWQ